MHYLTVSEPQGGRKSVPNSAREFEGPELEMNTDFSQKQGKHLSLIHISEPTRRA